MRRPKGLKAVILFVSLILVVGLLLLGILFTVLKFKPSYQKSEKFHYGRKYETSFSSFGGGKNKYFCDGMCYCYKGTDSEYTKRMMNEYKGNSLAEAMTVAQAGFDIDCKDACPTLNPKTDKPSYERNEDGTIVIHFEDGTAHFPNKDTRWFEAEVNRCSANDKLFKSDQEAPTDKKQFRCSGHCVPNLPITSNFECENLKKTQKLRWLNPAGNFAAEVTEFYRERVIHDLCSTESGGVCNAGQYGEFNVECVAAK